MREQAAAAGGHQGSDADRQISLSVVARPGHDLWGQQLVSAAKRTILKAASGAERGLCA